jgi:diacylglycerol kinase family enzyme
MMLQFPVFIDTKVRICGCRSRRDWYNTTTKIRDALFGEVVLPPVVSTYVLPREIDRVVILINPKAGRESAHPLAEQLAERLRREGIVAELFTDLAEATSQANRWHAEGRLRALIGAGGDGTMAELVNRTTEGVPLTLIPAGTSNLLAKYFHFGKTLNSLCRTVTEGVTARIDAGRANGRIFLLVAGCGFDAAVVQRVHAQRNGHIRLSTYFKPILEMIWCYDYPEIRIHWDDGLAAPSEWSARWMFVFNLPCYGVLNWPYRRGGLQITPRAVGSDGWLDMCSLRRGHLLPSLGYLAAILLGQHPRLADCTLQRIRRLRMTSDVPVPYQLDGDPGGFLPLDIEVAPSRVTLVVPRESVDVRNDMASAIESPVAKS